MEDYEKITSRHVTLQPHPEDRMSSVKCCQPISCSLVSSALSLTHTLSLTSPPSPLSALNSN
jgi:hypothetical protein